jgi:hypothetical protein
MPENYAHKNNEAHPLRPILKSQLDKYGHLLKKCLEKNIGSIKCQQQQHQQQLYYLFNSKFLFLANHRNTFLNVKICSLF